jgi:hypothetical protein
MTQTLRFDGVNDHVTIPSLPDMTGNWQVEFKVTIRANVNTVILGNADFTRFIEMRVALGQIRVRALAGTSYDVPCPMALGETCTILITSTTVPARLTVFKNGVQTGQVTFTQGIGGFIYIGRNSTAYGNFDLYTLRMWDASVDRLYSAAGITSGTVLPELNNAANNGTLVNFPASPWINDELFTLPETVTPGVDFTSTALAPFTNGAATITFGNLAVGVTIAGGQFTTQMPMPVDGGLYPKVPLTASISLVQGANTFSIFRPIALPLGHETIRDGDGITGNPTNFTGIIIDDDEYIGKWFADAGNPLTTSDTLYWDTSSNVKFYPDGSYSLPEDDVPENTTLKVRRAADNKIYFHPIDFDIAGQIASIGMLTGSKLYATKIPASRLTGSKL